MCIPFPGALTGTDPFPILTWFIRRVSLPTHCVRSDTGQFWHIHVSLPTRGHQPIYDTTQLKSCHYNAGLARTNWHEKPPLSYLNGIDLTPCYAMLNSMTDLTNMKEYPL